MQMRYVFKFSRVFNDDHVFQYISIIAKRKYIKTYKLHVWVR